MSDEEIKAAMGQIRTARPSPAVEFVHPKVYRQRAECPLWTNRPNPAHIHNRDCVGDRP